MTLGPDHGEPAEAPLRPASRVRRGTETTLRGLTWLNDRLAGAQMVLAVALLLVFVSLTCFEVLRRYLFSASLIWGPEVATMALTWSVFLGSALCFREGKHLVVDVISPRRPRLQHLSLVVVALINLLYLIAVVNFGLLALPMGMRTGTPILGIPGAIGWCSLVVMGITGVLYVIESLVRSALSDWTQAPAEPAPAVTVAS